MRNYVIEDIYDENIDKIEDGLKELGFMGPIEGMFYIPLPEGLLQQEQKDHLGECGPYMLALEVIRDIAGNSLKMELLVRARNKIRCSCVCYCTPEQRAHMMDYLDTFIKDLDIAV